MRTQDQDTLNNRLKVVLRKVSNVRKNCVGGGEVKSEQLLEVLKRLILIANGSPVLFQPSANPYLSSPNCAPSY